MTAARGDWLDALCALWADGTIPPGGMVWEDPPGRLGGAGGQGVRGMPKRLWSAAQNAPYIVSVPMPTLRVRQQMYDYLLRRPQRWARVYDGSWAGANAVSWWFRKKDAAGLVDAVARRRGLTVAAYVRYLGVSEDVVAL